MIKLYNDCNLFEGHFDGQKVETNLKCFLKNVAIKLISYFFLVNNLIDFIFSEKLTSDKLIYLTYLEITNGFGAKYVNLVSNLVVILIISFSFDAFKQLAENPNKFNSFQFLFCEDVNLMQRKYHLNKKLAIKQIKYQTLFKKHINFWHQIYAIVLFLFVLKYANRNLIDLSFDLLFVLKLIMYFLLFIEMYKSSFIMLLMTSEFNLSCLYLSNCLTTLDCKIQNLSLLNDEPEKLIKSFLVLLYDYSIIIKNQKLMNDHFDKSLTFLQGVNGL